MQTQIDCKNIIIEKEKECDEVEWWNRRGSRQSGRAMVRGGKKGRDLRRENRRGTRDDSTMGGGSSTRFVSRRAALLRGGSSKDRTKERNAREADPASRFATSLRTSFTRPRPLCLRESCTTHTCDYSTRTHRGPWGSLLAAY